MKTGVTGRVVGPLWVEGLAGPRSPSTVLAPGHVHRFFGTDIANVTGIALEGSWEPLEADFLTDTLSYEDVVRSGEQVREQLQHYFGHTQLAAIVTELDALRQLVEGLSGKVDVLANNLVQTVCIPLRSFAPEPLEVAIPIDIVISPDEEDGFKASFLDANLHAYGETPEEALSNMRATIVEAYQRLRELPDSQLGRSMLRQKQVLSRHLREA